jgi:hypothetical protein
MVIRKLIITIFFISVSNVAFSQSVYNIRGMAPNYKFENLKKNTSRPEFVNTPLFTILSITAMLINPEVLYENKKVEFGLTKEISLAVFPLGRLAFEYSYIFRGYSQNHLRLSYNYDFYKARDIVAYGFSPGAGYFSDTKLSGYFFQASYGFLIPAFESMNLALHPYLKIRYTVVPRETVHNFADISLGLGLYFYTGF